MTDLQEKAMRMALERLESHEYWMDEDAIQALRQALAQPEQEFVGACVTCGAPKGEWLVDAVNMSQERVDETAKREHEWVGLTVEEARKFYEKYTDREELIYAIDKFLEEKNGE